MNDNYDLTEKLMHLQWLLHKRHLQDRMARGPMGDSSRGQGRILTMLKLKDGIPTKDLAYLLGIRISSLNESLAKLEKSGYITRDPDESDRRVILISLTEQGRNAEIPEDGDDIFATLSAEDREKFSELLDQVIAQAETKVEAEFAERRERMSAFIEAERENMGEEWYERMTHKLGRMDRKLRHRPHRGRAGLDGGGFAGGGFERRFR
ncbi:MAG: MarR family transcriptional regulator [Propionibacteriaceae bacterium]|jgi:DNA-binding MarR family transcriptional regulator|nr:MarR family transcriptional regulator [Propionibacteriaceae bacterium]